MLSTLVGRLLTVLIPAIKACSAESGDTVEIIMDNANAFQEFKRIFVGQGIGFREIMMVSR